MKAARIITKVIYLILSSGLIVSAAGADNLDMELKQGWNLISIPLPPPDTAVNTVFSNINGKYRDVWMYDASNPQDHWQHFQPDYSSFSDLKDIDVNKGYWIYAAKNTVFTVAGTPGAAFLEPITGKEGWTLIIWPYLYQQPIIEALAPAEIGKDYDLVKRFNAETQTWEYFSRNGKNPFTVFEPGRAYYIHVLKEGSGYIPPGLNLPAMPTLSSFVSPTNKNTQTISGGKDRNTSIWINRAEEVPLDNLETWSATLQLNEGGNIIVITSRDSRGNISRPRTETIFLDTTGNPWGGWPFETGDYVDSSPVIVDLDDDGKLEVLVIAGYYDRHLYGLDIQGKFLWKYNEDYSLTAAADYPAAADLDGDGNLEVLVDGYDGNLYCQDYAGRVLWEYECPGEIASSSVIADLDADGNLEILINSDDGNLYCIDENRQLLWRYDSCRGRPFPPALSDLDGNGSLEILIASDDGNLYCIDKQGRLLWKADTDNGVYASPVIADLDADGNPEILVSASDKVCCFDKDGRRTWVYSNDPPETIKMSPSLADLNGDGKLEILAAAEEGNLYCLNSEAELIWSYAAGGIVSSPAIADLDGDDDLEILIGSTDAYFYCLDKDGRLIWKYETGAGIVSSPAAADLDGDGSLEVLFGSRDKNLYCLNKDGKVFIPRESPGEINPMAWPMFKHDLQRTGLYDRTPPVIPIVEDGGDFTNNPGQLYASWVSQDKQAGISGYQYKVMGESIEGDVVRSWTPAGGFNYVTAGGLNLINAQTYYFGVKARNNTGIWSAVGYSDGIIVDTIAPKTTISDINDLWHNTPVTVTLTAVDAGVGVDKTYYSTDGTDPQLLYTEPFTISQDGIYILKYYSSDRAGNLEPIQTAPYEVKMDTTPPDKVELKIKEGGYTNTTNITLLPSAEDAAQMMISTNGDFSGADWEDYAVEKIFVLSEGEGQKTVYIQYRDEVGNQTSIISKAIILDTIVPTIEIISPLSGSKVSGTL